MADPDGSLASNTTLRPCCEGRLGNWIVGASQAMLITPLLIIWILLVVIFGAAFFFLLIGAGPDDYGKAKEFLNISIQGLNVMFTYAAIANEPIRLRALIRLFRVRGTVGVNYEGSVSEDIFDYVAWIHRFNIIVILNLNCIFQYINQGFRIKYYSWKLVTFTPNAVIWTNLFFALSFLCAAWAPAYQWRACQRVRKQGRAPHGQELDPLQRFVGKEDYTWCDLWHAGLMFLNGYIQRFVGEEEYNFWDLWSALWVRLVATTRKKMDDDIDETKQDETEKHDDTNTSRTQRFDSTMSLEQMENGAANDDEIPEAEKEENPDDSSATAI